MGEPVGKCHLCGLHSDRGSQADGKNPKLDGKHQQKQKPDPEGRRAGRQHTVACDQAVRPSLAEGSRQDAEKKAKYTCKYPADAISQRELRNRSPTISITGRRYRREIPISLSEVLKTRRQSALSSALHPQYSLSSSTCSGSWSREPPAHIALKRVDGGQGQQEKGSCADQSQKHGCPYQIFSCPSCQSAHGFCLLSCI